MTRQTPQQDAHAPDLEPVQAVFAELGLLADAAEHEPPAAVAASSDADPAEPQAATLSFARALFAQAARSLDRDPRMFARLVDRLADELGEPRVDVARELLDVPELPDERRGFASRMLLALVEGGDRRLTRLSFDLHDGPMQELLLLGEDLRVFRGQLASVLGADRQAWLLQGRLDDLDARLAALERGLRRISTAVHTSVPAAGPFGEAVSEMADAFAARTGIAPSLRLDGDLTLMSSSQRIALLSVVGEALNNVREHGHGASEVEIRVALDNGGVSARVRDDGCGFDVEAALLGAARHGRIGLAGIHERVRLLGGECVVDSRPGGPTVVSLTLPRWEPRTGSVALAGD
ncbi:MAG TPA: ATP-binding protein [Solirubrobacteraceae bacterium]|nr:ATP-binding protein [Solirubrobacteraceae bacterium]